VNSLPNQSPEALGVIVAVIFFTMVTVAVAAIKLAPRIAEGRIVFDVVPDQPQAFGYKMAWLAVRTRDMRAVVDALGLIEPEPANWKSGLGTVYDPLLGDWHVFVSPPVNGWILVASRTLPSPASRRLVDKTLPMLHELADRFVEVQYFASYPELDFYAWARVIEGRLLRAFAINDEGMVWNKGKITKEERGLGLKMFEVRGVRGRRDEAGKEVMLYPTETHMMQLALKWSLDPTRLDPAQAGPALGVIAKAPAAWRPERLLKAVRAA
jgi:hypothetical protein